MNTNIAHETASGTAKTWDERKRALHAAERPALLLRPSEERRNENGQELDQDATLGELAFRAFGDGETTVARCCLSSTASMLRQIAEGQADPLNDTLVSLAARCEAAVIFDHRIEDANARDSGMIEALRNRVAELEALLRADTAEAKVQRHARPAKKSAKGGAR